MDRQQQQRERQTPFRQLPVHLKSTSIRSSSSSLATLTRTMRKTSPTTSTLSTIVLLLQSLLVVFIGVIILDTTATDSNVDAYNIHYQRFSSTTTTSCRSLRRQQRPQQSLLRHGRSTTKLASSSSSCSMPIDRIGPSLMSPFRFSSSTTVTATRATMTTMLLSKLGSGDEDVDEGITNSNNDQGNVNNDGEDEDELVLLSADVRGRPAGVVLEDLDWRVMKLRLEEENTRRFLKAGPRFLPYDEARKWVQAWGQRWMTQSDWNSWIEKGEKRNSYIPSRPEEYYTKRGSWISWDHFLGVDNENDDDPNKEQSS